MSTWKKVVVLNLGGLVGIAVSLLFVPQATPLWIWASMCAGVLALLNCLAFARKQNRGGLKSAGGSMVVIAVGFGLLLLELALRFLRH